MKKIVWIDVGTHFAQEHKSIFGTNLYFYTFLLRRFIGGKILKRGKFIPLRNLSRLIDTRNNIRNKANNFYSIFIEANPKVAYKEKFYPNADLFFNIAMTDRNHSPVSITKLFIGNGGEFAEGNSIYKQKFQSGNNSYIPTIGVSSENFFHELENYLSKKFNGYKIMLRLNCEGVEDEVIYAAQRIFGNKLKLIAGSLKDVKELRGEDAFNKLFKFMHEEGLPFIQFSSGIDTWLDSNLAILEMLDQTNLK